MLEKLQAICNKYEELSAKSEQPDFYADLRRRRGCSGKKTIWSPLWKPFTPTIRRSRTWRTLRS